MRRAKVVRSRRRDFSFLYFLHVPIFSKHALTNTNSIDISRAVGRKHGEMYFQMKHPAIYKMVRFVDFQERYGGMQIPIWMECRCIWGPMLHTNLELPDSEYSTTECSTTDMCDRCRCDCD